MLVFLSTSSTEAKLFEITVNNGTCTRQILKEYTRPTFTTEEGLTGILKDEKNCDLIYGRQRYVPAARLCAVLSSRPDSRHQLGRTIKEYTFFSYEVNEALHLSERERHTFIDCLQNIQEELQHSVDRMSKRLIANHIELLLNYCLRFYERQFITRQDAHHDILTRFETFLDQYFTGDNAAQKGLPSVKHCASEDSLSTRFPVSAALHSCIQESHRNDSK